jgi:hypothetical protein
MMKSRLLAPVGIVALAGSIAGMLAAQTPASPSFEVASIKPTKTQGTTLLMFYPGGRLTATNCGPTSR